ncbi:MAG: chromosome segregation protein SMC [Terrimicrobiaceae bacterium]
MYLQSLEMIGFKSFANRTILNFHRGVTAVVGPNGCGKSNVLDALRWVLGEQSAKALRGGEMADVIFGGTDSRGALGMAEVSLTFSECEKELGVEWNEVRITRRVHRDGKSEYFLNKSACRLKDIHELFMDTGVGRSAYSIMEQGKIDLILSSRPEDRRAIFEEAAGITKYKAQKKEALRKLEYTEANLLRVQDIIKEVRRQIGSLQRQAAKARRYQGIMQDLRTFDTHLSHKNYVELRGELESIRTELHGIEEGRVIHDREIGQQETELESFRSEISARDSEIIGLRDTAQEVRNRMFSAENRIATNAERVSEGRELVARHHTDIAAAEEKISIQQNQLQETEQQIASMIEAMNAREADLATQEEKVAAARAERSAHEQAINQISNEAARLEAKLGSLRTEISSAASRRESGETRQRLLQGESEAAIAAVAEIVARLEQIARRRAESAAALESARAAQASATSAYEGAQKLRQESEYALNVASKEAAAVESRLEVLRQLQQQGEGFGEGTQAVLRGLDDPSLFKPAVLGALADHIRVEERYIPAIEAALGATLQAILFKDPSVARAAIERLTTKRLGHAAAIPREWIPSPQPGNRELPPQALGWASEFVSGDGEPRDLASQLLDGVVVVENLEAAFQIKEARRELAVATLSGEFIDRTGIIRGGQSGENAGHSALARKAQIEALDRDLGNAIAKLQQATTARGAAVEALESAQARVMESREAVQAAQVENASCENEKQLCERQRADLEARTSAFAREVVQIEESLRASHSKLSDLETAISGTLAELEASRARKGASEQDVQAARDREASAIEALNEVRVEVATNRQQQENLARQRGPMNARLNELAELLTARNRDIANYEQRITELETESETLKASLESFTSELSASEARIAGVSSARDDIRSQAEALEMALRAARSQLLALQDQKGRMEVRAAQVEMRAENLRNHVSQRYQTDLEAFEPDTYSLVTALRERTKKKTAAQETAESSDSMEPNAASELTEPPAAIESVVVEDISETPTEEPEGIPWDKIEEIVADLTERVESMGPVNLDAIQEFEELEQRQLFLEKQNADLVNSKVELMEVISKINRTTRELFADTFVKIRDNFQVMFTELFGGGAANLLLVDESDPLESGIEIIAKPPGKQLKSISLLSGGERTMTAVALLFGIYMVKPSPFCVLDEMDAPLDESNISRFIKILDRFVDQSQFVVITHNKRTISRAEMLYGVTMEEHGVSKLVSVRFSEQSNERQAAESVAEAFGKHGDLHSEREAGRQMV